MRLEAWLFIGAGALLTAIYAWMFHVAFSDRQPKIRRTIDESKEALRVAEKIRCSPFGPRNPWCGQVKPPPPPAPPPKR